ncbi:hypothetical protein DFH27DRAFT_524267 [Peziza echinospora]|nr:hypothetical protein DFH27DRAFT_524267 [Peziza echinospora]
MRESPWGSKSATWFSISEHQTTKVPHCIPIILISMLNDNTATSTVDESLPLSKDDQVTHPTAVPKAIKSKLPLPTKRPYREKRVVILRSTYSPKAEIRTSDVAESKEVMLSQVSLEKMPLGSTSGNDGKKPSIYSSTAINVMKKGQDQAQLEFLLGACGERRMETETEPSDLEKMGEVEISDGTPERMIFGGISGNEGKTGAEREYDNWLQEGAGEVDEGDDNDWENDNRSYASLFGDDSQDVVARNGTMGTNGSDYGRS